MNFNLGGFNGCPKPFLKEADFNETGGYVGGRYCGASPLNPDVVCCLPCPVQQWIYPESYIQQLKIPNWISLASLALTGFLIISFIVLPAKDTKRNFLSLGLLFFVLFIALSFTIPLGTQPELCYDEITPNGMENDMGCAWTGALISAGGLGSVIWVCLQNIWLHIRVCWDKEPGKLFFIFSILFGILAPAGLVVVEMLKTGVSYRLGQTCLINHENSIVTFWAWLVAFASVAFLLSFTTMGYCVWVYVKSARRTPGGSTGTPRRETGTPYGVRAPAAITRAQHWKKIRQLIVIQWRNIVVSMLVVIESVYFVAVFWAQDIKLGNVSTAATDIAASKRWAACLTITGGDKEACFEFADGLMVDKATVIASLVLASLVGPELFILLVRRSMFTAWWHLLASPFRRFQRRGSHELTSLEMIQQGPPDILDRDLLRKPPSEPDADGQASGGPRGDPLAFTHTELEHDRRRPFSYEPMTPDLPDQEVHYAMNQPPGNERYCGPLASQHENQIDEIGVSPLQSSQHDVQWRQHPPAEQHEPHDLIQQEEQTFEPRRDSIASNHSRSPSIPQVLRTGASIIASPTSPTDMATTSVNSMNFAGKPLPMYGGSDTTQRSETPNNMPLLSSLSPGPQHQQPTSSASDHSPSKFTPYRTPSAYSKVLNAASPLITPASSPAPGKVGPWKPPPPIEQSPQFSKAPATQTQRIWNEDGTVFEDVTSPVDLQRQMQYHLGPTPSPHSSSLYSQSPQPYIQSMYRPQEHQHQSYHKTDSPRPSILEGQAQFYAYPVPSFQPPRLAPQPPARSTSSSYIQNTSHYPITQVSQFLKRTGTTSSQTSTRSNFSTSSKRSLNTNRQQQSMIQDADLHLGDPSTGEDMPPQPKLAPLVHPSPKNAARLSLLEAQVPERLSRLFGVGGGGNSNSKDMVKGAAVAKSSGNINGEVKESSPGRLSRIFGGGSTKIDEGDGKIKEASPRISILLGIGSPESREAHNTNDKEPTANSSLNKPSVVATNDNPEKQEQTPDKPTRQSPQHKISGNPMPFKGFLPLTQPIPPATAAVSSPSSSSPQTSKTRTTTNRLSRLFRYDPQPSTPALQAASSTSPDPALRHKPNLFPHEPPPPESISNASKADTNPISPTSSPPTKRTSTLNRLSRIFHPHSSSTDNEQHSSSPSRAPSQSQTQTTTSQTPPSSSSLPFSSPSSSSAHKSSHIRRRISGIANAEHLPVWAKERMGITSSSSTTPSSATATATTTTTTVATNANPTTTTPSHNPPSSSSPPHAQINSVEPASPSPQQDNVEEQPQTKLGGPTSHQPQDGNGDQEREQMPELGMVRRGDLDARRAGLGMNPVSPV